MILFFFNFITKTRKTSCSCISFCLFPTRFVCIGDFFREIPDNYCITPAALIDAKCLVFPQQRGFDWCEVSSFAQQRGFDWYEAKFYDLPSIAVLIDAAILHGTDTELSFIHVLPLTC